MIQKLPVSSGCLKEDLCKIQDQAELQVSPPPDYINRSNIVRYFTGRKRSVLESLGGSNRKLKKKKKNLNKTCFLRQYNACHLKSNFQSFMESLINMSAYSLVIKWLGGWRYLSCTGYITVIYKQKFPKAYWVADLSTGDFVKHCLRIIATFYGQRGKPMGT